MWINTNTRTCLYRYNRNSRVTHISSLRRFVYMSLTYPIKDNERIGFGKSSRRRVAMTEADIGISRTTLKAYLRKLNEEGCSIADALELNDESLGRLLWHSDENTLQRESKLNRLHKHSELRRVGVTRLQLWKELHQHKPLR